jgi:mono/diheme cytochrome c family protein
MRHLTLLASLLCATAVQAAGDSLGELDPKAGFDMAMVEKGRYLVQISGCNDCHTPGYLQGEGSVPVSDWLIGDRFGWRGTWGTTYGANLRLFMADKSQSQWVAFAKTMKVRPVMPWYTLNAMKEEDLAAIYQFVRYLGPKGTPAPDYVPPGREPMGPYAQFPPASPQP